MEINQYGVFLIALDSTIGKEIKKSRPCLVISPDEMNLNFGTIIIAPMTTKFHNFPTRVNLKFKSKNGWIVLDQIQSIDKVRLIKKLGSIDSVTIKKVKSTILELLVK